LTNEELPRITYHGTDIQTLTKFYMADISFYSCDLYLNSFNFRIIIFFFGLVFIKKIIKLKN
jgi:hypothetical protein